MSSNRLVNDSNNTQLKQARNCVNPDLSKNLNVHIKTRSFDDPCFVDVRTRQSVGPGRYSVANNFHCECKIPDVVRVATNVPQMTFRDGYGVAGCVIDDDSNLRVGKTRKYPKCPNQLFARPYATVPYMGRGPGNPDVELEILTGESTTQKRQCNVLSGVTIPNFFTPLIPHIKENIQKPENIIPEAALDGWIRGGAPSRLVVRDIDYLERCGYKYMDKEANREFWGKKHQYL
jgi:hypothetical protein|tara:strand:+ start:252 stop:950 length:699 start_codon:yes stop_codon:yes gene_type:complete